MLTLPDGNRCLRIVGLDPGTDLGVALLDVDLCDRSITLIEATTFGGHSLARAYGNIAAVHGERAARNLAHENNLTGYFYYSEPHEIVSESPFMGRFPQAFASLTECIMSIRRAVLRYDPLMPLRMIDPPTVKIAMGVYGRSSDKELMKSGLQGKKNLLNPSNIPIADLDEHSVDAIAVAYARAVEIVSLC